MRYGWLGVGLVLVAIGYNVWRWDSLPPTVDWQSTPSRLNDNGRISVRLHDPGLGLRRVEVLLVSGAQRQPVVAETYPSPWPWQSPHPGLSLDIPVREWIQKGLLNEGEFGLEILLEDQPNLWWWDNRLVQHQTFQLDLTPPRIQLLSRQHYLRQGGSEAILYRTSEDATASGVKVGENVFQGFPLTSHGQGTHICLFALARGQEPSVPMAVWAVDQAGNETETSFWAEVKSTRFRNRQIRLTDSLLETLLPEILDRVPEASGREDPLEAFLWINRELRAENHQQIAALSRNSTAEPRWSEAFLQLSNSKVESLYGDHRTYYYAGQEVDQQTHLGFDLASLAHAPVECANDGIVIFADYLGIYGHTVLVDHGLGLLSLYGHLSQIDVRPGQKVARGDPLGLTGKSGLAAGDHLHFSMILQGVQVNPLEWWDPQWVQLHVLAKLGGSASNK